MYGGDYDTADGTGVRDFIHVVDLAKGHVAALRKLVSKPGLKVYNLGTGNGYSVLEVLHAMEKACGFEIPYQIKDRRPGDIGAAYADPTRAHAELEWQAELDMERICEDAWRWQQMNPEGFGGTDKE